VKRVTEDTVVWVEMRRGVFVSGFQPSVLMDGDNLGLRPRLVCVGPLALKANSRDVTMALGQLLTIRLS
jgi:hypothetical protein